MDVKCCSNNKLLYRMSEFKFACPVCGQHMACDSSQAGSVMECPTCFQKITAPQATVSDEHKFILTGSKFVEKKNIEQGAAMIPLRRGPGKFLVLGLIAVVLIAAVAALVAFHEKLSQLVSASAWQAEDIGGVGVPGSFSQAKGIFTIAGSGVDIWHQSDGFHFVFQPLNGDGSLTVQVLNIANTDEWAKAGVMIRESTNASSMFILASVRADGQAQSIWRYVTGEEAQASKLVGGMGCPKWLKIERHSNAFSAYYKVIAGDQWEQLGKTRMLGTATNAWIGLALCAHHNGILCEA